MQVIILLLIFGMRKSIHLVVHLFIESGKAVQAMPLIVVQPFVVNLRRDYYDLDRLYLNIEPNNYDFSDIFSGDIVAIFMGVLFLMDRKFRFWSN